MKDNPMYDAEKARAYKESRGRMYGENIQYNEWTMSKTIEVPALVVDLTEEEFRTIKKAVWEII